MSTVDSLGGGTAPPSSTYCFSAVSNIMAARIVSTATALSRKFINSVVIFLTDCCLIGVNELMIAIIEAWVTELSELLMIE